MWRQDLGWAATAVLLPWLAGSLFIVILYRGGELDAVAAIGLSGVFLAASVLATVISQRVLRSAVRQATAALGPEAESSSLPASVVRLSPTARTMRPAMLRLDRAWQTHALQLRTRLAAAEGVIAAMPDPLILLDRRRRIVGANAAAAEFVGAAVEPRDLAGPLRNPELLAAVDAMLRGEPVRGVEFTLSVPVERVLRAHLARIGNAHGDGQAPDGAVAILTLHDVTELKRSEQMRADFIANAGHELKTPLATLIGFIETLLGPARDDATARKRFLGIMHEQAARMTRLVNDLLSLSRIELNEHVAPTGRVALAPMIEEVARGFELRAGERGIRITLAMPPELPDVQGDRDELAQIFQNLLDNAVKYARPQSEVLVAGEAGNGTSAGLVRVAVTDQGDGIASVHLPRLTERFYRVDTARSRELGGTGLGLAIVKHILNRHRGRLEITSKVGQGSTFTVLLRAGRDRGDRAATKR